MAEGEIANGKIKPPICSTSFRGKRFGHRRGRCRISAWQRRTAVSSGVRIQNSGQPLCQCPLSVSVAE